MFVPNDERKQILADFTAQRDALSRKYSKEVGIITAEIEQLQSLAELEKAAYILSNGRDGLLNAVTAEEMYKLDQETTWTPISVVYAALTEAMGTHPMLNFDLAYNASDFPTLYYSIVVDSEDSSDENMSELYELGNEIQPIVETQWQIAQKYEQKEVRVDVTGDSRSRSVYFNGDSWEFKEESDQSFRTHETLADALVNFFTKDKKND